MNLDTRKMILQSATKLFAQNGYEGVRTKQIALNANISEVTLFKYFPQKEMLYKTLLEEFFHTLDLSSIITKLTYSDLENDLLKIAMVISKNAIVNIDIILMRQKEKLNFLNNIKFDILKDPSYLALLPVFEKYYDSKKITITPEVCANVFVTSINGSFCLLANNNFNETVYLSYISDFVMIFCKGIQ